MARPVAEFSVHDVSVRIVNWRNLKQVDWMLPIFVLLLALIGWATMYSASRSSDIDYFYKQVSVFFMGASLALFIVCVDYRFLVAFGPIMYIGAVLLLVATLKIGTEAKGSERWLVLGPFRMQPSEITKLILIYALAWYFTTIGERIKKLHWFILTFVIAGIPTVLILAQPNLGTAACLGPLVVVMLYVAGCRFWHLGVVFLLGLAMVPVLWWQMADFDPVADRPKPSSYYEAHPEEERPPPKEFYELHYHQKQRIYTFLNPEADLSGSGWHTYQSKITVGSGGLFGKGFLNSTQTRLNYLPEHHTDFIYSLLAEERGFVGAVVVIGLFAAFLLRGLMFARDCPEMMGTLLAAGVVTVLAFHVFVNIAITVGLLPVTGIPLPFLSYGRSFYMTTMMCVGVLLSVPIRRNVFVN